MSDLQQTPSSNPDPAKDSQAAELTEIHLCENNEPHAPEAPAAHKREYSDPYEVDRPVPFPLIFAIALLFAWGGYYFATYKGDFRSDIFDPNWKPGGGGAVAEAVFDPLKRGERLFANNCQACHQGNGGGVPGAFPPLAGSRWVTDDDGTRMVKILLRGMQGPIEVMGGKYDGNMPSYGENGLGWNDRDIAAVATWTRQAWANDAAAVSEERVKEIREEIADRGTTWRGEEILSAHPLK